MATGVVAVLLLAWLGFFLHRSPRFAGRGAGAAFGIAAAACRLVSPACTVAKRLPSVAVRIKSHVSMKAQLDLHVYAGLLAAFLVIVHSAHKFDSLMDIALMTLLLFVVVGGYAVRHLLIFVGHEVKDWRARLQTGPGDVDQVWGARNDPG